MGKLNFDCGNSIEDFSLQTTHEEPLRIDIHPGGLSNSPLSL